MITERQCISLILDPKVRSKAKGHLEEWMFESDLYREISKSLFKKEFVDTIPDIRLTITSIQASNSRIPGEDIFREVDMLLSKHMDFSEDQIKAAISLVQEFIQSRLLAKSVDLASNSGVKEAMPYLNKAVNISLSQTDDVLDLSNSEKVLTLYEEDFPPGFKEIKSSFLLLNHSSSCKGYKYGDLSLYVAPPGVGKTTMLVCEGVNFLAQGLKVFHLILGDMSGYDLYSKYAARILEEDCNEIIGNPLKYSNNATVKEALKNLRVEVGPSFKYTAEQVVSRAMAIKEVFDFNVIILDYDLNVAQTNSESMYQEGGYSYGLYKGLAMTKKCLFVLATQPKIEYWEHEIIPVTAAAESSRKQHHIDYMITLGRKKGSTLVGTLNMAKVRRGITGKMARIKFEGHTSLIKEIFQAEYEAIASEEKNKAKEDIII